MFYQILFLIILILLNAYFAASEIAFISLNDAKVEKLAKQGDKKSKQILKMLQNPSKFLATIQIGITLAGFLSSAFASETFADHLAPILNQNFPALSIGIWKSISIIVITLILSYFTLVFGELVPKRLAMKHYEKISYHTIGVIRFLSLISAPFVKLLTFSTTIVSKLFGVTEEEEEIVTEEEIRMMIDQGEEKGTIEETEKELLNNIFEFNDKICSEVMIPRTDVFALEIHSQLDQIIDKIDSFKYSRIPVYDETIDNVAGILYVKDLLRKLAKKEPIVLKKLVRKAYFVPESKPIDELFKELQRNKTQIAIVVDEYGGTAGLITMEDILEEIVGNIFDEYDDYEKDFEQLDENTYLISGSVSIFELKKILGVEIPERDYDTLSGYLLEELGRIPLDNEKPEIETTAVTYKIEEYTDKRIIWVKACKNNPQPTESDEEEDEESKEDNKEKPEEN